MIYWCQARFLVFYPHKVAFIPFQTLLLHGNGGVQKLKGLFSSTYVCAIVAFYESAPTQILKYKPVVQQWLIMDCLHVSGIYTILITVSETRICRIHVVLKVMIGFHGDSRCQGGFPWLMYSITLSDLCDQSRILFVFLVKWRYKFCFYSISFYSVTPLCLLLCCCRQEFGSDQCPDLTREIYRQDIHCVGSLCKLYFRELPNPLLTYELYKKFKVRCFCSMFYFHCGWRSYCSCTMHSVSVYVITRKTKFLGFLKKYHPVPAPKL